MSEPRTKSPQINRCKRCGHVWAQRKHSGKPKRCASCRSPYWDKERRK